MSLRPDGARQSVTAGKLNRRLSLERYGITFNSDNEPLEAWTSLATVWGAATPTSDSEKVRAAQVGATVSMRFVVAYSALTANLNAKDRIIFDSKVFDVIGVKELGFRQGFEISALAEADA